MDPEELVAYFASQFGPVLGDAYCEIVPTDPVVVVHRIDPSELYPWYTLFTTGMSASVVSDQASEQRGEVNAELYMHLDPSWPLDRQSLNDPANRWPIDRLRALARIPHHFPGWTGRPVEIFMNESPEDTFAPGCSYTGAFAFREREMVRENDRRVIGLYRVVPLYWEELQLIEASGLPVLLHAFDRQGISFATQKLRKNVALSA